MKQGSKYYLFFLMFTLLSITEAKAHITIGNIAAKQSDCSYSISHKQIANGCILYANFSYSYPSREVISATDTQSFFSKDPLRIFSNLKECKNTGLPALETDRRLLIHLHPDPIGYYIFTLKKIII